MSSGWTLNTNWADLLHSGFAWLYIAEVFLLLNPRPEPVQTCLQFKLPNTCVLIQRIIFLLKPQTLFLSSLRTGPEVTQGFWVLPSNSAFTTAVVWLPQSSQLKKVNIDLSSELWSSSLYYLIKCLEPGSFPFRRLRAMLRQCTLLQLSTHGHTTILLCKHKDCLSCLYYYNECQYILQIPPAFKYKGTLWVVIVTATDMKQSVMWVYLFQGSPCGSWWWSSLKTSWSGSCCWLPVSPL